MRACLGYIAGQLAFSSSSVDELHDNTSAAIFTKSIMNGDLNAE